MRAQKLAHGDLQHGNVVVVNHELKLIDYDGMFVPSFQGMRSNEVGHPNYQHPRRRETDFGVFTDNFSAWIIYASLRIIASSPETYNLTRGLGRDECLIFNQEDFANPGASPIFSHLRSQGDGSIIKLTEQIASLLNQSPRDVPPLDVSPIDNEAVVPPVAGPSDWWKDHLPPDEEAHEPPTRLPPVPTRTLEFGSQRQAQREMLGFIVASCAAYIAGILTGAIGPIGYLIAQLGILLSALARLEYHFRACPEVAARDRHIGEVHLKEEETLEKQKRFEQNRTKIQANDAQMKRLASELQQEIANLTGIQGSEIKQAYTDQAVARTELDKRKRALDAEEERELHSAIGRLEVDARNVQTQLNGLVSKKAEMVALALERCRVAAMNRFLAQHFVSGASLPGIGPRFKANLAYKGIRTAADVTFSNVRVVGGFGQARTATVVAWRDNLAAHYKNRLPSRLRAPDAEQIENHFQINRTTLENQLRTIEQNMATARSRVAMNFEGRKTQLRAEDALFSSSVQQRLRDINARHNAKIASTQASFEQMRRNIERETTNTRLLNTSLESDLRRIQNWLHDVGIPKSKEYESLTFERFLRVVFTNKFDS